MSTRIRNRWLLVLLVACGQMVCLAVGVAWFSRWLERGLGELVRRQVLEDNQRIARQLVGLIELMDLKDLRVDPAFPQANPDWERLQQVIERIDLPNEGFLCVVGGSDGRMICHPQLRQQSDLWGTAIGAVVLHAPDGETSTLASASGDGGVTSGWAEMHGGIHLIAVEDLPGLDAKVLAHQREAGIVALIGEIIGDLRTMGMLVTVVLIASGVLVTAFIVQRYENRLAAINANLEQIAERRGQALTKTRDAVIFGLAKLAESRDDATGQHLERIRSYSELLAGEISKTHDEIDESMVGTIGLTSSLHDIGKVGVPDSVLLKPAGLTPEERETIRKHTTIGGDCLLAIKRRLGEDDFLVTACEITLGHHERWDGEGYPYGMKGDHIPLSARIVSLADVYDALTTRRPYKEPYSHEQTSEMIISAAGSQFDPAVVNAFVACRERFEAVASEPLGEMFV